MKLGIKYIVSVTRMMSPHYLHVFNSFNQLIENNAITMGRVLFTYNAVKEDEVSVNKGEIVQVMGTNQYNMFLIHRPANQSSPPAEGWVPMYIIGSREGDGSLE